MPVKNKTVILTVVRHGQTDGNKERRLQGVTDSPLNDTGIKQAHAAGKVLKDTIFHQAYSSDLKRANKTCQIILEENQRSSIKSNDIHVDHQIKEKHFGKYEDMLINDFIIMAKAANTNPYEYTPETAETDESVEIRTKAFLLDAIKKSAALEENEFPSILMVSHGIVIRQLFRIFFDQFGCKLPNENLKIGAHNRLDVGNTNWSKFVIEVSDENHGIKSISCEELFNENHLSALQ